MSFQDSWPKMPDDSDFDGKQLLTLVRSGDSPFHGVWDINLLVQEIEKVLGTEVIDIPVVFKGSNNYGFHLKLSNRLDIVARLARGDVNMPNYDGFPIQVQVSEARFEVVVYELLCLEPNILASSLLYHRIQVQHVGPRLDPPRDIAGRRLFLFEKAEGENNVWRDLGSEQRACLLAQAARIRASLFNFNLPLDFAAAWLRERLFEQKPKSLPIPVASTREFCAALFTSKIKATIRNIGDMIGWEDDNNTVGPIAAAAKQSLLRLIPHILPADIDQTFLYRLVLEHGDFGIHNMSITMDASGQPLVTSLYDWETGCIVPAILSDPLMAVWVDLVTDEDAAPSFIRAPDGATSGECAQYMVWARQYFMALFSQAPNYERAIQAGKDARHLWFALREWRGDDPEGFFGDLGAWAERRMRELGVDSAMLRTVHSNRRTRACTI
ncbi:3-hydroxybutyryl-CoA dehydratase [Bisporella sp. PMI_857]|nr:3-hydroxybutyryl-CoA dehydratase [Bisporella sp. PMI_857]